MGRTRTRGSGSEATQGPDSAPTRQDDLEAGSIVGRYRVERPIGAGGMGIVVAARDPELDRPVAIKIMHHADGLSERWLRREAQALAQLNHPSIVGVLDVGMLEDRPFIAMELVDGVTLRVWLDEKRRSTKEILTVFAAAGRGLAAAHAARITHCDFKPSNVMICRGAGETMRLGDAVRIMDFGLARQATDDGESDDAQLGEYGSGLSLSEDFTGFGKVRGTPKYMAPEQFALETVGPPADQFSFCLALYEALWGSSPFEGASPAARIAEQMTGATPRRPSAPRSQRALVDAVLRGLSPLPEDRWPTMDALVDALEPASGTWLWGAGLAIVAALGAAAWLMPTTDDRCAGAGSSLETIWNDAERESVAAAFERTGRPYASDLWKTARKEIDAWATGWTTAMAANCRATYQGGGQSERDHDTRLHCLERQMRTLETVLGGLRSVDADSVGRGLDTIALLPDPAGCTADADIAPRPSDPERAAALDAGYAAVDACRVLSSAGNIMPALACAQEALAQAQELGEPHLLFDARRAHALAVADSGKKDEALRLSEALYFDVQAAGRTELAAKTALTLAYEYSTTRGDADAARQWLRRAETICQSDAGRGKCARTESHIERRAGNEQRSIERARQAVAIEDRRGPSKGLGLALNTLGRALTNAGKYEDARQAYERSLQVHEALNGGSHDSVATAHNNLGTVFAELGQLEASLRSLERALEIRRGILPHEHRHIATATANIGESHARLGRHDRALPFFVESAEIFEAVEGRQSPEHGFVRVSISTALRELGRLEEARASLDIALGTCRHLALETVVRFHAEMELALLEEASGNPEAAVAFFESALEAPLREQDRKLAMGELERLRGPTPMR